MTPGARVQAAIELLDEIAQGAAAEQVLTSWARRSRFAGSKDRRAVRDHVYQALRCQRSFAAIGGGVSGRCLMLGALRDAGLDPDEFFNGVGHAPAALSPDEKAPSTSDDPMAEWNLPDWLIERFQRDLGPRALKTAQALSQRAPVMLRVNLRKTDVETARHSLLKDGITSDPVPISTTALRVTDGAARLQNSSAFLDGLVELQDGSSQAAMEQLHVPETAKVLDYCAGGGGKTLALAGRSDAGWFAHDALPQRMKDLSSRAARAGVNVTQLATAELATHAPYDLVLCDVPCSGSGTWRRTPQAKWQLSTDDLDHLGEVQAHILSDAAQLVGENGELVYATCSVFACENQDQVQNFLAQNPEWTCFSETSWPVSDDGDGFFVSRLMRVGI